MTQRRLSAAERRRSIVRAAIPIFASRGFHGATTRDLAAAAGVSEALLYRHFPSKEALYHAITEGHLEDEELHPGVGRLLALKPSTHRLVLTVEYLLAHVLEGGQEFPRLMTHSLLGDGVFARTALGRFYAELSPYVLESLAAARKSGDIQSDASEDTSGLWWLQHLALSMRLMSLPEKPVVRYGGSRKQAVEKAVRFALRGLGLRQEAIDRLYRPGAWRTV